MLPTFIYSSFVFFLVRHAFPNDGGVQQQLNDSLMLNNKNKTMGNKEGGFFFFAVEKPSPDPACLFLCHGSNG